jgi:hypothetical protein
MGGARKRGEPALPFDRGTDMGSQLDDVEGFADLVDGAALEAVAEYLSTFAGRHHDYRHVVQSRVVPQLVRDVDAPLTGCGKTKRFQWIVPDSRR